MIVVDASVWVDLLLGRLPDTLTEALVSDSCASPPHVDFEVGAALVRAERRAVIPAGHAVELVRAFRSVPVERPWHPSDPLEALALINNATYADAWYLAMAARLRCAVMTLDSGMAKGAATRGIPVIDGAGSGL